MLSGIIYKNKCLMLNDYYKDFSPKLRAFMGEWATYFVVDSYRRQHATADISNRDFFKTETFSIGPCGPFDETYHYLLGLCLFMKIDQTSLCKANCKYEEVWDTIYSKFAEPKHDNISLFFECSHDWATSPLATSEKESFTIDDGCKPLFTQLSREGYILSFGDNNFWSEKIRPYFEARKYWKPKGYVEKYSLEWSVIDDLEQPYIEALNKCAAVGDIISAVSLLQKSPVFKSIVKTHRLKSFNMARKVVELMFPSVWGEKQSKPLHWKWYGEIPSQGRF